VSDIVDSQRPNRGARRRTGGARPWRGAAL